MRRVVAGILPLVAAVSLASCSSSGGGSPTGSGPASSSSNSEGASGSGGIATTSPAPTGGKAANPVDVLRKTGAGVPAGATAGTDGPDGTRETRGVYFATEQGSAIGRRRADRGHDVPERCSPQRVGRRPGELGRRALVHHVRPRAHRGHRSRGRLHGHRGVRPACRDHRAAGAREAHPPRLGTARLSSSLPS